MGINNLIHKDNKGLTRKQRKNAKRLTLSRSVDPDSYRRNIFEFYDDNDEVIYRAMGDEWFRVYDVQGQKIGSVRRIFFNKPRWLKHELAIPLDFEVSIRGKRLGRVCSDVRITRHKLDVSFNGWTIDVNLIGGKNYIRDTQGEIVGEIDKHFSGRDVIMIYKDEFTEFLMFLTVVFFAYGDIASSHGGG